MNRIIVATVLVMTLLTGTAFAADENGVFQPAPKDIDVIINNEPLVMDVAPVIVNDRTMVPMRAIFEALGANVTWIPTDRLIVATQSDKVVVMQIDNTTMVLEKAGVDEKQLITLDAVPYILNDRTLVPVRAVSEALEADVKWSEATRTVIITKNEGNVSGAGTN